MSNQLDKMVIDAWRKLPAEQQEAEFLKAQDEIGRLRLQLADSTETFDPQAVRELLDAEHAWRESSTCYCPDTAAVTVAWNKFKLTLQRVRESEKK